MRLAGFALSCLGVGLAAEAVRETFARFLILVEPDHIVVRRHLFGVGTTRTLALGTASRAEVEPSNNRPAPRIMIVGEKESMYLDTALVNEDKGWLVDAINERIASGTVRDE